MASGPVPRRTFLKRAADRRRRRRGRRRGGVRDEGAVLRRVGRLRCSAPARRRDAVAGQARRVPDAREPFVQPHVRRVPGGDRHHAGRRGRRAARFRSDRAGVAARRPAALPRRRRCNDVNDGRMDGFTMYDRGEYPYVDWAMSMHERDTVANWWHWAETLRAVRPRVRLGEQRVVPEPPVHDRGHLRRGVRQHGERQGSPPAPGLAQDVGVRRARGRVRDAVRRRAPARLRRTTRPCFRSTRRANSSAARGIDWAFYSANERTTGYFWNAYASIERVFHTDLWDDHIRDVARIVPDIRGRPAALGDVGDAALRVLRPPAVLDDLGAELGDRVDQRDHAEPDVALDGDLRHVGRVGRPVRPGRARRRRRAGAGRPGPDAGDLAVGASGAWSTTRSASSPRRTGSSRTTSTCSYLSDRVRNTHNFEHVFDFSRGRRRPDRARPAAAAAAGPGAAVPPGHDIGWPPAVSPARHSEVSTGTQRFLSLGFRLRW